MNITPATVRDVVTAEDDFAFEMSVASVLARHPWFHVAHGGTYTDSVTGKPRQFDFRAVVGESGKSITLAVECKNLRKVSPIVVCGCPRVKDEAFHEIVWSIRGVNNFRRGSTMTGLSSETKRARGSESLYPEGSFVGKSIFRLEPANEAGKPPHPPATRFKRGSDSDIYEKWAQSIASLASPIKEATDLAKRFECNSHLSAFLPIVVIPTNSLWICEYEPSGNLKEDPRNVDDCTYYVGRAFQLKKSDWPHTFTISHIHFLTVEGLGRLLTEFHPTQSKWENVFPDSAKVIPPAILSS